MPLVTSESLLLDAQRNGYAVGAFNVENMEMAQAVISAEKEEHSPVIIQTTPSTTKYGTLPVYSALITCLAEQAGIPVALHLDHGDSFELAVQAIREGYTSVMIDGSHLGFEENIELTKSVVRVAYAIRIPVEAELGKVRGKEDGRQADKDEYTRPEQAREFVERTGVSSLAVSIGTAHGVYSGIPKLDIVRLTKIQREVAVPLVLHGASGLKDQDIQNCISHGICKVNFATELRIAYSNAAKNTFNKTPDVFDPKKYGTVGREEVKAQVKSRMRVCGCCGKG